MQQLDPIQILEIRELIEELGQDHSVLLSTHILTEVQSVCNRVLIINNGRLVLDQDMGLLHEGARQVRHIRLGLHSPPDIAFLMTLSGIESIEVIDTHRFLITCDPHTDVTGILVQEAVSCGWGLFELSPEGDTLETTFMRLTRGDIPAQDAGEVSA